MYIFTQYICVHLNRIIDLKSANPRYNSNNAQLNISVILNPVFIEDYGNDCSHGNKGRRRNSMKWNEDNTTI